MTTSMLAGTGWVAALSRAGAAEDQLRPSVTSGGSPEGPMSPAVASPLIGTSPSSRLGERRKQRRTRIEGRS